MKFNTQNVSRILTVILLGFSIYIILDSGYEPEKGFSWERAVETIREMPDTPFLAAFAVFPLVGVPVMIFLAAAGLKFGFVYGVLYSTAIVYFHNAAAYWLGGQLFHEPLQRTIQKRGWELPRIPGRHEIWFTFVYVLIPGIPYAPKLYLLSLTGIPFRTYFWIGGTTYVVTNVMYVFIGSVSESFKPSLWIAALALTFCGLGLTLWWKKRLQKKRAPRVD